MRQTRLGGGRAIKVNARAQVFAFAFLPLFRQRSDTKNLRCQSYAARLQIPWHNNMYNRPFNSLTASVDSAVSPNRHPQTYRVRQLYVVHCCVSDRVE